MLDEINEEDMDTIFGPAIEYEQPAKPTAEIEKYYRLSAMFKWFKSHGKCDCGTPMEFEDYYQHGECLECLQKEAIGNIEA